MQHAPIIAPSILAADFSRLGEEIARVSTADWVHVDIMDGHFVPNLSFGPDITATVRALTDKPLDVHLMIENPERWVERYARAGAATLIFHVEATEDPVGLARTIRDLGVRAAFSLKPATPIEPYLSHLEHFDEVLVMSVEPGFGGQSFMPDQLDKVRALRREIDARGLDTLIEIDGGISEETIGAAAQAGCDAFVAGSAVYKAEDPAGMVTSLRERARLS
ncbi:ribulose-phosphate 3-epimerase [Corynebacterium mastitidis]|uniref:ribulose-phosphate 3-epimerase n=1 Tax=Corynebacterium mastitidis TaxID=161890 RepID=UPI0030EA3571